MADNTVQLQMTLSGNAIKQLERVNKSLSGLNKEAVKTNNVFKNTFEVFAGGLGAIGVAKGFAVLSRQFGDIKGNALELSRAMAEVNSILPKTEQLTIETTDAFIDFSNQFSGTAAGQAKAFYQIVSAGVKTTSKQLEVLEASNKAAVAGLVDIEKAADALTTSVNSYSQSGLTATEASDTLFIAVREGKTTFGELGDSIGRVAALASNAGVTFSDLTGTVAFLTKGGLDTTEAITGLRGILRAVIKPTEESRKEAKKLGIEFENGIEKAGGLGNFLEIVRKRAAGVEGAFGRLFGETNAINAVTAIAAGNFKDFQRILGETANSAGATDAAFKIISKSAAFQFDRLVQQLENLPQALFKNFDEPLADAIKSVRKFVSDEGILLIADAIDIVIDSFVTLSGVVTTGAKAINFIQDLAAANKQADLEFVKSALERQLASGNLNKAEANATGQRLLRIRKELRDIKKFREENDADNLALEQKQDERERKAAELQSKIEASRQREVDANKKKNETIDQQDQDFLNKKRENKQAEVDMIEEFRAASEIRDIEKLEMDILNEELKNSAELQRLADILGKKEALRIAHDAKVLAQEGKHAEARKKLSDGLRKAEEQDVTKFVKFEELSQQQRISNQRQTFGQIATLSRSSNRTLFNIGKAASLAQATIDGIAAVQLALKAAPPPFNFALAALVGVAQAANVAKIASAQPPKLATGIDSVPAGFNNDTFPALLSTNERVVPAQTNLDLTKFLADQSETKGLLMQIANTLASQPVVVNIGNEEIVNTLNDSISSGRAVSV